MESQLIAIAIKSDSSKGSLISATKGLASVYDFRVPLESLRVGTLDSLMALSDDLVKIDMLAESTCNKIHTRLCELGRSKPSVIGVDPVAYTTKQWEWDEAKFQMKTPLRELCESISGRVASIDDELKAKVSEVTQLKANLQAAERKMQGNLIIRGLTDLVKEEDVLETEYMTSVFIVVPKAGVKEFEDGYERMATYVVPRSAKLLSEDSEYALYRVAVFKKSLDEFKQKARDKRYTVREFAYDPSKLAEEESKKAADLDAHERLKSLLVNWCQINFAEAWIMMVHLKAVRIFVESVLRYGLAAAGGRDMRPNFTSLILHPKKGKTDALRKALSNLYGGGLGIHADDGGDSAAVPGASGGEFFPYVSLSIETEPQVS
jgi:V-type H+-transporting ATPase subunit C